MSSENGVRPSPSGSTTGEKLPIEKLFLKRECIKFVPEKEHGIIRCKCGHARNEHPDSVTEQGSRRPSFVGDKWSPEVNTVTFPTDAYGIIEFQGGSHPSKAKFVRLAYDTSPDKILSLLLNSWKLQLPNLLISIQGGISNFVLQPKLQQAFRAGLLKAAKTTGAWIVASGTNTGVMRHVGDALGNTLMQSRNNIVTIGIAPWGVVQNNRYLIGTDHVIEYHAVPEPSSSSVLLSPNQSYFLLADNGTVGKYGSEILLRRRLEKFLSQQKFTNRSGTENCSIPVVCLVLEGGTNTIRTVLEYVTDRPPVPVVVCDGSGRAADLLAFAHKYSRSDGTIEESLCEQLKATIEKIFQYSRQQAEKLLTELLLCVRDKELLTVLRMGEENQDLDLAILTALLRGQNSSTVQKLNLVMSWDRADIARSHIFIYGQEWPKGALDQAMMNALASDRSDFVKLLLENGVNMQKWLTISRLEELYNLVLNQKVVPAHGVFATSTHQQKLDSASTLRYLLREYKKDIPSGYRFSLMDIGQVINRLMGGAYLSEYSSKSFRILCNAVLKQEHSINSIVSQVPVLVNNISLHSGFRYPFSHLMIWAVLLRRQRLAKFMWEHGEEAMAKALVAYKLYERMAYEAAQDDLETDVSEDLKQYSREFSELALELLELCYQTDVDLTYQLLTYELTTWSSQTCLSLAASSAFQEFVAHSCCQILLTELWMGGLIVRKYSPLKVILGIVFFPSIFFLEYKTKQQLQQMPQTAEEHKHLMDDQHSDTNTSSDDDDDDDIDDDDDEERDRDNDDDYMHSQRRRKSQQEPTKVEGSAAISGNKQLLSPTDTNTVPRKADGNLSLYKKIYEFYTAPVTKFWAYSISYVLFLFMFCYMVLIKSPVTPSWIEIYVILYVTGLAFDKLREFIMSEPTKMQQKLSIFFNDWWNVIDVIAVIFFFIGVLLRFTPDLILHSRVFYGMTFMILVVRILDLFSVSKHLGPYVNMIWKMVKDMLKFIIILLLVLMAFGIIRQAITYPNNDFDWDLVKEIFHKPYFMLYGEVYAGEIDPMCGNGTEYECVPGRWIVPAAMSIFLIIGNILLLSLLIAVFNNTFNYISSITNQVWKLQRYFLVVEYESKPFLPPPLVIVSHVILLFKCLKQRFQGRQEIFDHSLKLFLSPENVEKLHDFEEECMEDLFRKRKQDIRDSEEKLIELTAEKAERALMRVEDISLRENSIRLYLQNIDARLVKLEEIVQQTAQIALSLQQALGFVRSDDRPAFNPPSLNVVQKSALKNRLPGRFLSMPAGTDAGVPLPNWMTMTDADLSEQTEGCEEKNAGISGLEKDLPCKGVGVQGTKSDTKGGFMRNLGFGFTSCSSRPPGFKKTDISGSGDPVFTSSLKNTNPSNQPGSGFLVPGEDAQYRRMMNRPSDLGDKGSDGRVTQSHLGSAIPSVDVVPLQASLSPVQPMSQSVKNVECTRNSGEQESCVAAEDEFSSDNEAETETTQLLLSDEEQDEQRTHRSPKASELKPKQQTLVSAGENLRLKQIPTDNKLLLKRLLDSEKSAQKDV